MSDETQIKGDKIRKDSCLVETLGRLDSLQAQLDKCCYYAPGFQQYFRHCQYRIVDIGAELAKVSTKLTQTDIDVLDSFIVMINIQPPATFIKFTNLMSMEINEARVRTRDLERALVACDTRQILKDYCNKLSYFLFLIALKIEGMFNHELEQ